ncbi:pyridoxal phosphate-dependent aminotransferase [Vagococcus sp. BWB3-3]|uniref:cysteine-S-conjugate beta-lyase n=1 Tax=Vagococcus allomyrinae TaxID=2794353 RepID=A0A940SSC9_9ENTE|nr:MalY/PatB family protein [Vagococcus allomyrinae]MBP1041787.1 pyridoxal phosphate-dependent aminotransferase [Vagococcus allomyrinae]
MSKIDEFVEKYGVERKDTDSVKWDGMTENFGTNELLPMWVADMEFKGPEAMQQAMIKRVEHGAFGYSIVPDSYYEAFFNWQAERYQVNLEREWIRFSPGVVSSFFWMVNAFTAEQEGVIVLAPVYYPFYHSINDTNRLLVTSGLINEKGYFSIDYADFEAKIVENNVKLFIHCSPHNPVGRVWTAEEQNRLFDICLKHDVMIVSDEIHQDLTRQDHPHVAALALDEKYRSHLIVLNAPSKTFNLASLLNSHIVIADSELRKRYDAYANTTVKSVNSLFGMVATEAAYREGSQWLEGINDVIEHNFNSLKEIFAEKAPEIVLTEKEGTYLAWVDLRAYLKPDEVIDFMQVNCGIAVDYGEWFGEGYEGFIRINLGTLPKNVRFAATKIVEELAKR